MKEFNLKKTEIKAMCFIVDKIEDNEFKNNLQCILDLCDFEKILESSKKIKSCINRYNNSNK